MFKNSVIIISFLLLITSCKSTKNTTGKITSLTAKNIIKKNDNVSFDRSTVKASLSIKYKGKSELPSLNGSMRMIKDSVIWISLSKLGFPVAKLMITPNEVKFYEKVSKTYFDGNYKIISDLLGTDFNFEMVQNVFLGEPLFHLKNEKYKASIRENSYELVPKSKNPILSILFLIDPVTFKLNREDFKYADKGQNLTILYKDFNKIDESLFPKGFVIKAADKKTQTIIDVNYKNVLFDSAMRFPFQIPSGYKLIKIK